MSSNQTNNDNTDKSQEQIKQDETPSGPILVTQDDMRAALKNSLQYVIDPGARATVLEALKKVEEADLKRKEAEAGTGKDIGENEGKGKGLGKSGVS